MQNNERKILIDEELKKKVEQADWSYSVKRDLITQYINNGFDLTNPSYLSLVKESEEAYSRFNKAKAEVEREYVLKEFPEDTIKWTLDYATCMLTIKVIE